jgi:hypothetical protein
MDIKSILIDSLPSTFILSLVDIILDYHSAPYWLKFSLRRNDDHRLRKNKYRKQLFEFCSALFKFGEMETNIPLKNGKKETILRKGTGIEFKNCAIGTYLSFQDIGKIKTRVENVILYDETNDLDYMEYADRGPAAPLNPRLLSFFKEEKSENEKAENEKAENEKAENEKAENEKAENEKAENEKAENEKVKNEKGGE